eukprot:scaffold1295_cov79-Isochrysis_galbana.AAC.1
MMQYVYQVTYKKTTQKSHPRGKGSFPDSVYLLGVPKTNPTFPPKKKRTLHTKHPPLRGRALLPGAIRLMRETQSINAPPTKEGRGSHPPCPRASI